MTDNNNPSEHLEYWLRQITKDRERTILKQYGETSWLLRMQQKYLPETDQFEPPAGMRRGHLDADPLTRLPGPLIMPEAATRSAVSGSSEEPTHRENTPTCRSVPNQHTPAHPGGVAAISANPAVCRVSTPFNLIEEPLRSNFKLKGVPNQHTLATEMFLRNASEASPPSATPPSEEGDLTASDDGDFPPEDFRTDEAAAAHPSRPRHTPEDIPDGYRMLGLQPDILSGDFELMDNHGRKGISRWVVRSKTTIRLETRVYKHFLNFKTDKRLMRRRLSAVTRTERITSDWAKEFEGIIDAAFKKKTLMAMVELQEEKEFERNEQGLLQHVYTPVNGQYAVLELNEAGDFPVKLTIYTPEAIFEITQWNDERGKLTQAGKARKDGAPIAVGYLNRAKLDARKTEKIIRNRLSEEHYGTATPLVKAIKQYTQDEIDKVKDRIGSSALIVQGMVFDLQDENTLLRDRIADLEETVGRIRDRENNIDQLVMQAVMRLSGED